ncbi:MAG TPA: hypothetical protein VHY57_05215, partial [Rhizomicrobium sp.]|nr:hypothetical protein [Rhizomicrobium sp.]
MSSPLGVDRKEPACRSEHIGTGRTNSEQGLGLAPCLPPPQAQYPGSMNAPSPTLAANVMHFAR